MSKVTRLVRCRAGARAHSLVTPCVTHLQSFHRLVANPAAQSSATYCLLKLTFIHVRPQPLLLFVLCSSHPSIRASHRSRFLTLFGSENPDGGAGGWFGGWFWERLAAQVCPMGELSFTIPLSCVYSGFNSSESIRDFPWD